MVPWVVPVILDVPSLFVTPRHGIARSLLSTFRPRVLPRARFLLTFPYISLAPL